MKKYFYADKRYSIFSFLFGICLIVINVIINENLNEMIVTNSFIAKCISFFLTFFHMTLFLFTVYYLWNSIESRIKPLITICSHFIIMGLIIHEIIPWDQILTISIKNENTLTITYDTGTIKKQVKKAINHILNKNDLIELIQEYCKRNTIDFIEL